MKTKIDTIKRKNLSQVAAESIKEYIFENRLKAGDKLPTEVELTQTLGVSRSTVREAIKQIQMLGVLDVKPGQGAVIKEYDHDIIFQQMSWGVHINVSDASFRELIEARKVLELGVLPLVVQNNTEEHIAELEATVAKMEKSEDLRRHRQLDAVFHQTLLKSTGNRPIIHMGSIILDLFRKKIELYPDILPPDKIVLTNQEHRRIVDACRRRDLGALEAVARAHLGRD
jgi:GntR family transcriptional regulator, transcriptional repressor for pyruvate dehydrogenase complex